MYLKRLVLSALVVTSCIGAIRLCGGDRQSHATKTIIRGVQYRLSAVETLTGRALLRYVASQRMARVYRRIYAADEARLRDLGAVNVPPLGTDHACLLDFDYDLENHRWRSEIVDLTNTGFNWTGHLGLSAENRDMAPLHFYRISLCDGEKVYEYMRDMNLGFVRDYQPGQEPDQLRLVRSCIVATVQSVVIRALQDEGFVARQVGEDTISGTRCVTVRVDDPTGTKSMVARLWIAPELGHAAVRQEILSLTQDDKLHALTIVRADVFAELVPGLQCPKLVQVDHFYYSEQPDEEPREYTGADAWWFTEILQWDPGHVPPLRLHMEANVRFNIVSPFVFPFDATVQYETAAREGKRVRKSPSLLARMKLDELLSETETDPLGSQLTAESAATFSEGEH